MNEPGFDVFTANTRSVLYMKETTTGLPIAFVAIGALLVGSIKWTGGKQPGTKVERGDELGYVGPPLCILDLFNSSTFAVIAISLMEVAQSWLCSRKS